MSRQNSREISGINITLDGHEIGIDRVANTTLPFSDVKVLLKKGEKGDPGEWTDITIIAPAFSDTTAYAVGAYVTHEGKLYKCTTAHSAGAWNASHFTETSVDASFMAQGRDYVTAGRALNTTAGTKSTAEGQGNTASANYSHAEGNNTTASGHSSHAEGQNTIASKAQAHAEGASTTASGKYAHSEGSNTTASHDSSHAEGSYTQTGAVNQHVSGKYNVGKSTTLLEVGNGTSGSARANAFEVSSAGDVVASGNITDGSGNVLSAKLNASSPASKVAHPLTIGSINSIDFDGSHTAEVEIWNRIFCVEATGWSATVDSDGFYTQDIYPMLGSYIMHYDTDKPITITIAGATENARPTSAEAAAYNMIDPTWYYPDNPQTDGSYFRFYTKTKPTSDFYVRIAGFHVNQIT